MNFVGSIPRSLFGTLDGDDLELTNKNINKPFNENNKLKTIIANQTALIRKIVDYDSLQTTEKLNQDHNKFKNEMKLINVMTRYILKIDNAL